MSFLRMTNGRVYLHYWLGDNARFKISTKLKVDKSKWNEKRGRAKSDKLAYKGKRINAVLTQYEEVLQKVLAYCENNDCLTLENFRKKFREELGRPIIKKRRKIIRKNKSFLEFFKLFIDNHKKKGMTNWKSYNSTLNKLLEFLNGKDISFDEVDSVFFIKFSDFLEKQNLSLNYIDKHWKNIKSVMNNAFLLKLHNNEDFRHFKRRKEESDSIFLTTKEIKMIEDLCLTGLDEIIRDYFVLACYTGLRYSDWHKVKDEAIDEEKGLITIRSSKTGETSYIPLRPKIKGILTKYDGEMPKKPSRPIVNQRIKEICKLAGIKGTESKRITKGNKPVTLKIPRYNLVSTHTARRSFATNSIIDGVPSQIVMKITGHKSLKSFQLYVKINNLEASEQLKKYYK